MCLGGPVPYIHLRRRGCEEGKVKAALSRSSGSGLLLFIGAHQRFVGGCVFIYVIQCIAYFAGNRELISGMDMLYTKYTDIAAVNIHFKGAYVSF